MDRLFCCDAQDCRKDTRVDITEFCDGTSCMAAVKRCAQCDHGESSSMGGSKEVELENEKLMKEFLEICRVCNIPYDPANEHQHLIKPPVSEASSTSPSDNGFQRPPPVHGAFEGHNHDDKVHSHPKIFSCHWGFCSRSFTNMNELASHVNKEHLQPPQLPVFKTEDLSLLEASNPSTNSHQEHEEDKDGMYCLWDDCHRLPEEFLEPLSHGSGPKSETMAEKPKSLLLQHLVQDHLQMDPIDLLQFVSNPSFSFPIEPLNSPIINPTAVHKAHLSIGSSDPIHTISCNTGATSESSQTPTHPIDLRSPASSTSTLPLMNTTTDLASYLRVPGRSRRTQNLNSAPHGGFQCKWPWCRLQFETTAALMEHLGKDHVGSGKKEYICLWEGCERDENSRVFKQRQKIMRHLQSHTGDRPFVCDECGKAFTEATTLHQHMRTHTKEKPFVCSHPGCNKSFALASALTIHGRTHTGDKPFTCPQCLTSFSESSNLSKHMKIHRGEKEYVCPFENCGKKFGRSDQLARHKKVHFKGQS